MPFLLNFVDTTISGDTEISIAGSKRVTNGGTDNTDGIFGFQADLHYEADVIGTPNRTPNFYT